MAGSARRPEPRRVTDAADPVAAFVAAHEAGRPVALGTSGTSGAARSVLRSTASWVDSFPQVARRCRLDSSSRVWVPGPLSATMNLFAAVLAEHTGARSVGSLAEATHAFLTPRLLRSSLGTPGVDGAVAVVAGDRLAPALTALAAARGLQVHHYYGAAELSFVAWGSHADDLVPFDGVEVDVRDGEIWVRSPYLCDGYDGPSGALRRAPDGFATVGDRGRREGDRLVVLGRADAVTTGGATVLVADVEPVLRERARGEVVVVGVPHDELGQVVAAVLTVAADHEPLREQARGELDGAHRPRVWCHVPELPLTVHGKVDRDALVSLLSAPGGAVHRMP